MVILSDQRVIISDPQELFKMAERAQAPSRGDGRTQPWVTFLGMCFNRLLQYNQERKGINMFVFMGKNQCIAGSKESEYISEFTWLQKTPTDKTSMRADISEP